LNWKLEKEEGVAEGDFGTVGAGSDRLKAFRRKASYLQHKLSLDFNRYRRLKSGNPETTAAGSPNIHRSGD
jgi:hypothetical protein